jgi:hypothetical protein
MTAIWCKQDIGAYVTERRLTNTQTQQKHAVVSLTKARKIHLPIELKNETPPNQ